MSTKRKAKAKPPEPKRRPLTLRITQAVSGVFQLSIGKARQLWQNAA